METAVLEAVCKYIYGADSARNGKTLNNDVDSCLIFLSGPIL